MFKITNLFLIIISLGSLWVVPELALAQTTTPTVTPRVLRRIENLQKAENRIDDRIASRSARVTSFIGRHATLANAQLTAKNGSVLTVSKDGKTYTINTDTHTQLRRHFWGQATLDEIAVNDQLNIFGKWTDDAKTTILATLIRDTNIQKKNAVFIGTITAISGNTWTINTVARGTQTVTVSSTVKYQNRKEQTISQTDVLVGHRIRIRGMWDNQANTITEVTHVKDFSLPIIPVPSPTPAS